MSIHLQLYLSYLELYNVIIIIIVELIIKPPKGMLELCPVLFIFLLLNDHALSTVIP